jgi:hypothetical protein
MPLRVRGDDHALVDQRVQRLAAQLGFGRQARAGAGLRLGLRSMRRSTSPAVTSSWLTTATM